MCTSFPTKVPPPQDRKLAKTDENLDHNQHVEVLKRRLCYVLALLFGVDVDLTTHIYIVFSAQGTTRPVLIFRCPLRFADALW